MTNNKGPQVRLAWAYRAVLRDREVLEKRARPMKETVLCYREVPEK
jgi:hypothetical protein